VHEEIRSSVAARVAEGFLDRAAIVDGTVELLSDEFPPEELQPLVEAETDAALRAHQAEQRSWPPITDCDRLDRAFAALEVEGVTARQNFACCQSCGQAEIGDEMADGSTGYVFYHLQDTERAAEYGTLYLSYGTLNGDAVAIGHRVVDRLHREGLRTKWDGTLSQRIAVTGIDWKRRRQGVAG